MEDSGNRIKILENTEDALYEGAKLIVNAIPFVGPALTSTIDLVLGSPSEKRKNEFLHALDERLQFLEENHHLDLPSLATNEEFIDVLMQAAPLYIKTSVKQKRVALLNAISNTGIGHSPGESKASIFIRTLDSITVDHLKIIRFLDNPVRFSKGLGSSYASSNLHTHTLATLKLEFTDLSKDEAYLKFLWKDLGKLEIHQSAGLITGSSSDGVDLPVLTSFGKEFLAFIRFEE